MVFAVCRPSFLNRFVEPCRVQRVTSYFILSIDSMHDLHFEIFNLAKKCTIRYLSSERPTARPVLRGIGPFVILLAWIFRA